jgi:hypothetical protein
MLAPKFGFASLAGREIREARVVASGRLLDELLVRYWQGCRWLEMSGRARCCHQR